MTSALSNRQDELLQEGFRSSLDAFGVDMGAYAVEGLEALLCRAFHLCKDVLCNAACAGAESTAGFLVTGLACLLSNPLLRIAFQVRRASALLREGEGVRLEVGWNAMSVWLGFQAEGLKTFLRRSMGYFVDRGHEASSICFNKFGEGVIKVRCFSPSLSSTSLIVSWTVGLRHERSNGADVGGERELAGRGRLLRRRPRLRQHRHGRRRGGLPPPPLRRFRLRPGAGTSHHLLPIAGAQLATMVGDVAYNSLLGFLDQIWSRMRSGIVLTIDTLYGWFCSWFTGVKCIDSAHN